MPRLLALALTGLIWLAPKLLVIGIICLILWGAWGLFVVPEFGRAPLSFGETLGLGLSFLLVRLAILSAGGDAE